MQAEGAHTKMGTWAPNQEEAELTEMIVNKDEQWEELLKGKSAWLNRPAQPPGLLRSGDSHPFVLHIHTPSIHGAPLPGGPALLSPL